MNRLAGLVIAGLVLMVGVTPSWGGPPNPTASDESGNTAGGTGALETTSGGDDHSHNTAFGANALFNNRRLFNTAIGANALFNNTFGIGNTASGANALFNNTTGEQNTASGNASLFNNTEGNGNTATGGGALYSNTTGLSNTASGNGALSSNTNGDFNTASGARALRENTGGSHNTASGGYALEGNTTVDFNTASGARALVRNTTGISNTASGASALESNTTGAYNTASGFLALEQNTTGARNTALGYQALQHGTGSQNIAIGSGAGAALTGGNRNIYLGHPGAASESKTVRLGSVQTKTFIAGVTTAAVSGTTVVINADGQLGTLLSSARYKRDIDPMGARSEGVLKLRPVTFVYKQDGQGVRQYGLIAEEVATVYPELVTHTATGEVQAVRYQELIPLLLNEVQRQQQAMERQQQVTEHLQRELAELRSLVGQMRGGLAAR